MKYIPALILTVSLLVITACQDPDGLKETKNETTHQTQRDTEIFRYTQENEVIPDKYIVLIKSVSQTGLYPEIKEVKKNFIEIERIDSELGFEQLAKTRNLAKSSENIFTAGTLIVKKYGMDKKNIRQIFNGATPGFLMNMSASQALELSHDPDVELIEQDRIIGLDIEALTKNPFIPSDIDLDVEYVPYGVDRVGGSVNFETNKELNTRWAWILDTGIDTDHPDLNVISRYSADFTSENNFDDEYGHGTHVAGILGAKMNKYGVSGVAAGANLVAVKVLNSKGKGSFSDLLEGLTHVMNYSRPDDVVNISLGGAKSAVIDKAVAKIGMSGVTVVMASGNDGKDIKDTSPASAEGYNLYTVGAIDWDDTFTDYSNYGSGLDFASPGHGILSTFLDGKYAYTSGTSMAAPHLAGVFLITKGKYVSNGYTWTPGGYVPIISHR